MSFAESGLHDGGWGSGFIALWERIHRMSRIRFAQPFFSLLSVLGIKFLLIYRAATEILGHQVSGSLKNYLRVFGEQKIYYSFKIKN